MLVTYSEEALRSASPFELSDALEQGKIVYFPDCPIDLPDEQELDLLRTELPKQIKLKNASYHPEADKLSGVSGDPEFEARVKHLLKQHSDRVAEFLRRIIPSLTPATS